MDILTTAILVLISIVAIVVLTSRTKLNPFASLFIVALILAIATLPNSHVIEILKSGFGNTIASIGFLIIFGAVIAVVMEKSNAAKSIANYILNKTGDKKAAKALGITGYLVGLPIFCDSGYIILSGLVKPFSKRAGIATPVIAFVLATSLYAVHCLTPTHPGALAAAEIVQADIGMLILLGALFAVPAAVAAYFWIQFSTKNIVLEENRDTESETEIETDTPLPSLLLALLPIVAPLLLITLASILSLLNAATNNIIFSFVTFIGQPIVALFIGAILSLFLLDKKLKTQHLPFTENLTETVLIKRLQSAVDRFILNVPSQLFQEKWQYFYFFMHPAIDSSSIVDDLSQHLKMEGILNQEPLTSYV